MKHGMLTRAAYSLMSSGQDPLTGVLTDESLNDGIQFKAKFIGSMEVPRPTNRVEIVAAMRTIRCEFRDKGIKKTKIDISISTTGVSVMKRSKAKLWKWMSVDDEDGKLLLQHPVFRIFYVSHDSQDLQIFSYIACDSANLFKCYVFKASDKNGAVHMVRAIGQVFDVCHRLNQQTSDSEPPVVRTNQVTKPDETLVQTTTEKEYPHLSLEKEDQSSSVDVKQDTWPPGIEIEHIADLQAISRISNVALSMEADTTSGQHFGVVLYQQLHLESLKSQNLAAEVELLQSQLKAESTARISLQERVQELVQQNQRLIHYIKQLDDVFSKRYIGPTSNQLIELHNSPKHISFPHLSTLFSAVTSPNMQGDAVLKSFSSGSHSGTSPDSGHREMSSEEGGASSCTNTPSDKSWFSAIAAATFSSSPSSVLNGSGTSRFDLTLQPDARQDSLLQDPSPQQGNAGMQLLSNGIFGVESSASVSSVKPALCTSKCSVDKSGMKLALNETGRCSSQDKFSRSVIGSSLLLDLDSGCVGESSLQVAESFPQFKHFEVT